MTNPDLFNPRARPRKRLAKGQIERVFREEKGCGRESVTLAVSIRNLEVCAKIAESGGRLFRHCNIMGRARALARLSTPQPSFQRKLESHCLPANDFAWSQSRISTRRRGETQRRGESQDGEPRGGLSASLREPRAASPL